MESALLKQSQHRGQNICSQKAVCNSTSALCSLGRTLKAPVEQVPGGVAADANEVHSRRRVAAQTARSWLWPGTCLASTANLIFCIFGRPCVMACTAHELLMLSSPLHWSSRQQATKRLMGQESQLCGIARAGRQDLQKLSGHLRLTCDIVATLPLCHSHVFHIKLAFRRIDPRQGHTRSCERSM